MLYWTHFLHLELLSGLHVILFKFAFYSQSDNRINQVQFSKGGEARKLSIVAMARMRPFFSLIPQTPKSKSLGGEYV